MRQWVLKPFQKSRVEELSDNLKISPLLARLLVNRNVGEPEKAHAFLYDSLKDLPNPFLLKDMEKAVARLIKAVRSREKIVVYGDYDVDGTVATALLSLFFDEIGHPIDYYIPHRIREGYSMNAHAVKKFREQGVSVIITVDNGITAEKEIRMAGELGIDVIVTDHHIIPGDLPPAYAVINPLRSDSAYPGREICGTGVACNLVMALRQKMREEGFFSGKGEPNLKKYLDLVALATVADVVDLVGVNRIFVKHGIAQMANTAWPGISALKKVSRINGNITAVHLGYYLGPRLNAAGRLYDASTSVKLILSRDKEAAFKLADDLDRANNERKCVENKILSEAVEMLEQDEARSRKMSHVLFCESWHPGVIGIVASRLANRFFRPVILLGKDGDALKGSGRSYGGLHLIDALRECADSLVKFGGHKAAVGLSLMPDKLENFRAGFEETVKSRLTLDDFTPRLAIDAELSLADVSTNCFNDITRLEPHGQGNPEPLFCAEGIGGKNGRIVGEKHLKFTAHAIDTTRQAIAFGFGEKSALLDSGPIDIAFSLKSDSYYGTESIVLNVRDMKPAGNSRQGNRPVAPAAKTGQIIV